MSSKVNDSKDNDLLVEDEFQSKKAPITTGTPTELESLRNILFGNQARATDTRLNQLETHLESQRLHLEEAIQEQVAAMGTQAAQQLEATRKAMTDQIARQFADQAEQQRSLQQELNARMDQMSTEFQQQFINLQQTFGKQISQLRSDLLERLQSTLAESRQRDDDLRQELLTMTAWLDNRKASRIDLGQMLMEVGQQLQGQMPPLDEGEE
jgi:DNA anti-recombination protein RmuC